MGDSVYRLWFELDPPPPRWLWWLVERRLTWPTKAMWLGKAEAGLRHLATEKGVTLIGDPMATAEQIDGRIVVRAGAIATGPFDPTAPTEHGPTGQDGERR